MKRLLREPLLHFFVIGLALFILYGILNPEDTAPDSRRITIGDGDVERITSMWMMQMRRPPTAEELQGLLKEHLREEVLYREARAMGLDEDDTIVRRRMAQKMSFLMQGVAEQVEPDDDELQEWFREHAETYRVPAYMTLEQVYLNVDRRGERAEQDAAALLAELQAGRVTFAEARERGDRILVPYEFRMASEREIARTFGNAFLEAVLDLEPGEWRGPVTSGYGLHVVRIQEKEDSRLPELEEVRDRVMTDWRDEKMRTTEDRILEDMLSRYDVRLSPGVDSLLTGAGVRLAGSPAP